MAKKYNPAPRVSNAGNEALRQEIERLNRRVTALEQTILVVSELDFAEALERARKVFDSRPGQKIYPDELAAILGTSVSQAVEVCTALEKEGSIVAQ
jgi:hypothetical protein